MKLKAAMISIGALGLAAGSGAVVPARAGTVYSINQTSTTPEVGGELSPLTDTVSRTITTDGTIGVLRSKNVLGWNLLLTDNLRPVDHVDLTPANSGIWFDTGNGLTASKSGLDFDFNLPGAAFIIQGTTHGFSSRYQYFCFQATSGPCAAGETIVPNYHSVDGVLATGLSGTVSLNPPAVPEPSTWALLSDGFAVLGLSVVGSRSRREWLSDPDIRFEFESRLWLAFLHTWSGPRSSRNTR